MNDFSIFGLYKWAAENPEKPMICDGRLTVSYGSFAEKVDMLAAGLDAKGIGKGDKIVVSLPNTVEFALLVFACLKLGALLVCVNLQFREQELAHLIPLIGEPKLAFLGRDYQIKVWSREFPSLEIVTVDSEDHELHTMQTLFTTGTVENRFSLDNDSFIVFTSGSSGTPKGVIVTAGNLYGQIRAMIARFHATSEDVMYIPGPFCQMSGLPWLLLTCYIGGKSVTCVRFDGSNAINLIEAHQVTILSGVTTMFSREIEAYEQMNPKPDISSLRTGAIGGAPIVREYMEWFEKNADCRLINAYGMTECPGIIFGDCNDSAEYRHTKAGKPLSNVTLALLDNHGHQVPIGEPGEICCKSTGVTKGYYNSPALTAQLLDKDGWLHTGDIGIMDAEGYVTLTGRKKDMIIRGGYNVFPAEIENAYCSHPHVVFAAAIPYNDPDLGQRIALFLQPRGNVDLQALTAYVSERLAKYKLPDRMIVLDKMPFLESGKINKKQLSELLEEN